MFCTPPGPLLPFLGATFLALVPFILLLDFAILNGMEYAFFGKIMNSRRSRNYLDTAAITELHAVETEYCVVWV